ncbi:DgyrCDS9151 [Dimorphilus gyrociliatus]|uniref:protein S-acyltransferase n=1 Tax=Dimorphilus gyrociliatus TaxID=2664684 RepID=A0A7I8VXH3_9ANNE|nr:DgyrCDS9151 [Dimorphilus gyrociliatus]
MANNTGVFILTCSLILITMTLFFAFDGRLLAQRVSPAIPVAAAILFIFVMSTLLRTAFSDPGILPRATVEEAAYNEAYEEQQNHNGQRPPPRTREVFVKVSKEKKDGEQSNFVDAIKKSPASIIEAIICFFSIWSIVGLAGFHTYLIASNQTTNEDIKGSYSNRRGVDNVNPFSEGNVFKNCCAILCGPFTPSLIRRRTYVVPEASRHGSSNGALTENNIITNNRQQNVYGTVESIHIQTDVVIICIIYFYL